MTGNRRRDLVGDDHLDGRIGCERRCRGDERVGVEELGVHIAPHHVAHEHRRRERQGDDGECPAQHLHLS